MTARFPSRQGRAHRHHHPRCEGEKGADTVLPTAFFLSVTQGNKTLNAADGKHRNSSTKYTFDLPLERFTAEMRLKCPRLLTDRSSP